MQSWPEYLYCFWDPGPAPCPRWESGQGRAGVGVVETLFLFPCSWINMPSLWSPSSDSMSSPSQKSVGSAQKALSPCSPTSLSCDDGSSQDTAQRWAAGRERFLHFGAPSISSAAFLSLFSSLCDSMCGTGKNIRNTVWRWMWWNTPVIPELGLWRQKDQEVKDSCVVSLASLDCTRLCVQTINKNKPNKQKMGSGEGRREEGKKCHTGSHWRLLLTLLTVSWLSYILQTSRISHLKCKLKGPARELHS